MPCQIPSQIVGRFLLNAVEGYDGAERGCMQLANDCNGHYLPAEWGMYPSSHLTSLQTHGNWSDTFSQHLLHTLHSLCTEKHLNPHKLCVQKNT